jgi:hypothetical protein
MQTAAAIEMPAEVPLSPCRACGELGRWASVKASGPVVNVLLEAAPHPLGMYAVLRDGRRAINLVWANEVQPGAGWLDWPGQRHRDHFKVCSGWPSLRVGSSIAAAAVDTIASDLDCQTTGGRPRSCRLRDWA